MKQTRGLDGPTFEGLPQHVQILFISSVVDGGNELLYATISHAPSPARVKKTITNSQASELTRVHLVKHRRSSPLLWRERSMKEREQTARRCRKNDLQN